MSRLIGRSIIRSSVAYQSGQRSYGGTTPSMQDHNEVIDLGGFPELSSPGVNTLRGIFSGSPYELRLCGGAVRDILSGVKPKDLDFATTATPEQMKELFDEHGVRRDINSETGAKHGTITCRISEENFEVTTLRIDKITDGRHAEVEFTRSWREDSCRRDLTVNSMFLGLDGKLYDFHQGRDHLRRRHIRFVNDPVQRIREDYLRILRYFRFYGRLASHPGGEHDVETLKAIEQNCAGLQKVSGERIWSELEMIVCGRMGCELVLTMHECGVLQQFAFPQQINTDEFVKVCRGSEHLQPSPMVRLAALLNTEEELQELRARLKFSNKHLSSALFIIRNRGVDALHGGDEEGRVRAYEDILVEASRKDKHALDSFRDLTKYTGDVRLMRHFDSYRLPRFPVGGKRVKERYGVKGPRVGHVIQLLFDEWKASRYTLTEEQLFQRVTLPK